MSLNIRKKRPIPERKTKFPTWVGPLSSFRNLNRGFIQKEYRHLEIAISTAATSSGRSIDESSSKVEREGHRAIFGGASNITAIDTKQAEKLYLSLPELANEQHVLLILYTPTCSHCKSMESQVRLLASGLSSEMDQLSIQALDCSTPAAKYFTKQVLGIPAVPAFCIFPRNSRTFYKYRGTSRDAESLLKFLNLVCNQNESRVWSLAPSAASSNASSTMPLLHTADSASAAATPEIAAASPTNITAVWAVGAVSLLLGLVALVMKGKKDQTHAHNASSQDLGAAEVVRESSTQEGGASSSSTRPMQKLLSDIDSTLVRMTGLILRLVRARLGLIIAPMDDASVAVAAGVGSSSKASSGSTPSPNGGASQAVRISGTSSIPLDGAGGLRGATVAAAIVTSTSPFVQHLDSYPHSASGSESTTSSLNMAVSTTHPTSAGFERPSPAVGLLERELSATSVSSAAGALEFTEDRMCQPAADMATMDFSASTASPYGTAATAGAAAASPVVPQLLDQKEALELAMKMQTTLGADTYLKADQVLALMEEEKDDVGRVIERLLQQQQQQGRGGSTRPVDM
ncbi:hypothetical protein CEUSTIGMA_g7559.t1 [Chlamydomonas eustigma]|uniref:Thioredoxin domain-containing protein n=1 Tax=Chlamydomonas eustigma TaxID=1157962 RepID=A0A250XAK3_9CHLO|nr:hypothetical protein CEUSTIGMA_g7559.t1 [Chlamydomonas eustigma]|eukprot:GAX80121.1 hypothetical protein CEUSTIGMA_g7559.t1 [Chlamydomonas eustigma]